MKLVKDTEGKILDANNVSDKEAEEAFKTIITWLGEDPNREGLLETPKRVMKAYKEYFLGYKVDPSKVLEKTFGDVDGYDDMVIQKNISIQKSSSKRRTTTKLLGGSEANYVLVVNNKHYIDSKTGKGLVSQKICRDIWDLLDREYKNKYFNQ